MVARGQKWRLVSRRIMGMFYLICHEHCGVVVVKSLYTFVKIHQITYTKLLDFVVN